MLTISPSTQVISQSANINGFASTATFWGSDSSTVLPPLPIGIPPKDCTLPPKVVGYYLGRSDFLTTNSEISLKFLNSALKLVHVYLGLPTWSIQRRSRFVSHSHIWSKRLHQQSEACHLRLRYHFCRRHIELNDSPNCSGKEHSRTESAVIDAESIDWRSVNKSIIWFCFNKLPTLVGSWGIGVDSANFFAASTSRPMQTKLASSAIALLNLYVFCAMSESTGCIMIIVFRVGADGIDIEWPNCKGQVCVTASQFTTVVRTVKSGIERKMLSLSTSNEFW